MIRRWFFIASVFIIVSAFFFIRQENSMIIELSSGLVLSSTCPPGFKKDAQNRCVNKNLYLQYTVPNAPGQNIRVVSADTQSLPLADVIYTPKSDAKWEIKKGDFEVAAATGNVKFTDKTQLILTEYLAYKDAGTFVILKELTENYMNIALGIHTEPSIIDKPTLLFHMSLTAE